MAINVYWDDDAQTIIRWDFVGAWTWDEFFASARESYRLRTGTNQDDEKPFSLLLNLGDTAPTLAGMLQNMHNAIMLDPHRNGVIVVCGTHKLTLRLAGMFSEAYAQLASKIVSTKTLAEAYRTIEERMTESDTPKE